MNRALIFVFLGALAALGAIGAVLVLRIADQRAPQVVVIAVPPPVQQPAPPPPAAAAPVAPPADPGAIEALNRKIRETAAAEEVIAEESGDRALMKRLREGVMAGDEAGTGVRLGAALAGETLENTAAEKQRLAQLSTEQRAREELLRIGREASLDPRCKTKWKPEAKARVRAATKQKLTAVSSAGGVDKERIDDDGRDLVSLLEAAKTLEDCTQALQTADRWAAGK
jgi:hypothetical protein